MAVSKGAKLVAPSVETKTKAELDSIKVEAGLYRCTDNVTITDAQGMGNGSSSWTVIVISNDILTDLKCYTQIWIGANGGTPINAFIRTSDGTSYGGFDRLVTPSYLEQKAVVNKTGTPTEIKIQNTQPAKEAGKNIVWIDTSN